MKALITVGCMTDHGGQIIIGDHTFLVEGKAVHLDGMPHFCPKCKIEARAIASNKGFMLVGGKSIVAVGDKATCGAKYIKISDLAVLSNGIGNSRDIKNSRTISPIKAYGQRFVLKDELTDEPLANVCYEIHQNGNVIHGKSDHDGFTQLITSGQFEEIEIRIISKEHNHD